MLRYGKMYKYYYTGTERMFSELDSINKQVRFLSNSIMIHNHNEMYIPPSIYSLLWENVNALINQSIKICELKTIEDLSKVLRQWKYKQNELHSKLRIIKNKYDGNRLF